MLDVPTGERSAPTEDGPALSVIVIVHEMSREAPPGLHSLSGAYQEGVDEDAYEVLVVENGSRRPLGGEVVRGFGDNFRYHYIERASPSPAAAMNLGISMTRGRHVGLLIDGARIASPGLIRLALAGLRLDDRSVVSTVAWHLCPRNQVQSTADGYDATVEDALLDSIGWPEHGYNLFTIAAFGGAACDGAFLPIAESNALFMSRELIEELGGYDERFTLPGGGLVNPDLYERTCALPDTILVRLLCEGTFLQVHGGIATNAPPGSDYTAEAFREYERLRSRPFRRPRRSPVYLGGVPSQALASVASSVRMWSTAVGGRDGVRGLA